jgi:hypothetical protein
MLVGSRKCCGGAQVMFKRTAQFWEIKMAKAYTQELADWAQQRCESARRHKNLVAFLLVKDDVNEAATQGWPIRAIWAHLCEQRRIDCGYQTFLNYVKRYVRQDAGRVPMVPQVPPVPTSTPGAPHRTAVTALPPTPGRAASGSNGHDQIPGFVFNPAANKEHLF